jgi:hypothetical protein
LSARAQLVQVPVNLEDFRGPLREWINLVRRRGGEALQQRALADVRACAGAAARGDSASLWPVPAHVPRRARQGHLPAAHQPDGSRCALPSGCSQPKPNATACGGRARAENKESLLVSYADLSNAVPLLAIWLADCPVEMLKVRSGCRAVGHES